MRQDPSRPAAAGLSRRFFLRSLAALPLAARFASPAAARRPERARGPRVAVVGAGAFGAFTAVFLARRGARVTLCDAWGPGNSRSSSGGETRVIRGVYGAERRYVELVARAFDLWRECEARWKRRLYHRTGALWMVASETPGEFVLASRPLLSEFGFPFQELSAGEASRRYPQISFEGIRWALYEERAGYLLARSACAAAVEAFIAEGGDYRTLRAEPGPVTSGAMGALRLSDGSGLSADAYVFACGPWLGSLFPDVVGDRIRPTRQEVFFFGTPAGDVRFSEERMPVWVEVGERLLYGIPGNERRGFKVADDTRGEPFDPTDGERIVSPAALAVARELLARRFPTLARAPLVESRVCQYENSPDGNFLLDRHPGAGNVWLVGGGSGHGFKFAPAWGERVADTVLHRRPPEPFFGISRFASSFRRPTANNPISKD